MNLKLIDVLAFKNILWVVQIPFIFNILATVGIVFAAGAGNFILAGLLAGYVILNFAVLIYAVYKIVKQVITALPMLQVLSKIG